MEKFAMENGILLDPATETDDRISLTEAQRMLPKREGKAPHLLTIRRWIASGVRGSSGQVKLRAFRVGRNWFTRVSWVRDFIANLTDGMDGMDGGATSGSSEPTKPRRPSRRLIEARQRLVAMGIKKETDCPSR
jgi:hypothetical protein